MSEIKREMEARYQMYQARLTQARRTAIKRELDALFAKPLGSASAIMERKRQELLIKGWTDAELNALDNTQRELDRQAGLRNVAYRIETPIDDLDTQSDPPADYYGHTWEQLAFSAYVFLACLGMLALIVAAYQLSLVKP